MWRLRSYYNKRFENFLLTMMMIRMSLPLCLTWQCITEQREQSVGTKTPARAGPPRCLFTAGRCCSGLVEYVSDSDCAGSSRDCALCLDCGHDCHLSRGCLRDHRCHGDRGCPPDHDCLGRHDCETCCVTLTSSGYESTTANDYTQHVQGLRHYWRQAIKHS